MMPRTEFGFTRTACACDQCRAYCRTLPGYLIPSDLARMMPENNWTEAEKIEWARVNLLASPGALVVKDGVMFRIPTLVPAARPSGKCIHLTADEKCAIHDSSPFGCAYFSCSSILQGDFYHLSNLGLTAVLQAQLNPVSLYYQIWHALWEEGKRAMKPEDLIDQVNGKVKC